MIDHTLSFIEVIPEQTNFDSWKEVNLNTGGTQSTLQDIKFTERADGFCYNNAHQTHPVYFTRNRFIYWKIFHDVLELVEQSLDINLYGNKIRYKFIDTPLLDGLSIHETQDNVIVLVPTVCSVHRLVFPHPRKLHRQDEFLGTSRDLKYPSVFSDAASADSKDSYSSYVFATPKFMDTQTPHVACSTLGPKNEGTFLLAYPSGDILLICHFPNGESSTYELKTDSFVPRIFTGWADKLRAKNQDLKSVVSVSMHSYQSEIYGLTLSRDGNLKFWSLAKKQCLSVTDIFNGSGDHDVIHSSQNHIFRKAVDSDDLETIFVVFINFTNESKFFLLKPMVIGDAIEMKLLHTIHSPERDLIDFSLTVSHIWSVWRTETGGCMVYSACLNSDNYNNNIWVPVSLESLPDINNSLIGEGDPRQMYLQSIFYPGRFPLNIINKALNIYKKTSIATEMNISVSTLKQQICLAVENEIRNELKETEVTDEDYLDCANWCWQRFYSCCLQYYVAELKPIGILLLPSVSGAVLIKKSTFSFLRPMDLLEHMVLCNDYMLRGHFLSNNALSANVDLIDSVMKVTDLIVYLEQQVSENFDYAFEKELSHSRSPDVVAEELIKKIQTEMDNEFSDEIFRRVRKCRHLYQAVHKFLELIRFDLDFIDEPGFLASDTLKSFFSSQLGTSVVARCIQQQAKVRFIICRNLLLVCSLLLEFKNIEYDTLEAIRSICIPELVIFTQANFVVLWLSSLPALPFFQQQSIIQRLSPLKSSPILTVNINKGCSVSLLELFVNSVSKHELVNVQMKGGEDIVAGHWHISLLPYVRHLFQLIWPISNKTTLPEWLLTNNQHIWLQQYVRLLSSWCEWNNSSRCFLFGISLLICGENQKATECFLLAAKGLFTDKVFVKKLLNITGEESQSEVYTKYYLRVIKLLDFHNAKDLVIKVANTALSMVSSGDAAAATLYSIIFKNHLELKHYEMAYDSLNSNPDPERKKDNLRDLVKKLLDEKRFDVLMKFTYGSLEELFCNIIVSRARAADAIDNIYYDFLYAYHIKRGAGFFRLAASVMYEQAIRLDQSNTIEGLEKQVKCLLAANNVLQLCDKQYAWVAKPISEPIEDDVVVLPSLAGSEDETLTVNLKHGIEVFHATDIEKEVELMCAKLKLVKFDPKYFQPETEPGELVFMLSTAGFFRDALKIAATYNLSAMPVFELLTRQCVLITEEDNFSSYSWLTENDFQDISSNKNASCIAWKLLQHYLQTHEKDNESVLHYAVTKKMIMMQMPLPYWLLASYKERNAAELLKLFIFNGRLEEAIELAKEYLIAILNYGKEKFGLKHRFLATSPAFVFPVHAVDSLLYEAEQQKEKNGNCNLEKEAAELKDLFVKYLKANVRVTNEKCYIHM